MNVSFSSRYERGTHTLDPFCPPSPASPDAGKKGSSRQDRRSANVAALTGKHPMGARSAAMILAAVQEKEGERGQEGDPAPAGGAAEGPGASPGGGVPPESPCGAGTGGGQGLSSPAGGGGATQQPGAGAPPASPVRPQASPPAGAPPPSPGVTGAVGAGAAAAVGLMSMSLPEDAVKDAHEAQAAGVVGHPGLPHRPLARVPPPRFQPSPQQQALGFPPAITLPPGSGLPALMLPPPLPGASAGAGAAPPLAGGGAAGGGGSSAGAPPGPGAAVEGVSAAGARPGPGSVAATATGAAPAGGREQGEALRELEAAAADALTGATIADAAVAAVAQVLAIKQAVAVHARAEATAARERLEAARSSGQLPPP